MTKEYLEAVDAVLNGVTVFYNHSGQMELDDISGSESHSCLLETRKDGSKIFAVRNEVYQWAEKDASLTGEFTDGFPLPASRFPLPASRFPLPASRFPLPASRFPLGVTG